MRYPKPFILAIIAKYPQIGHFMAVTDNRKMPKWVLIIGQPKNDPETQTEPFKPIC